MKLARVGPPGQEKPAIVAADGSLRDLSGVIADIDGEQLGLAALARLSALDADKLPKIDGMPRYGVPVSGIGKVIGIGLNYADHAAETHLPIPSEPFVFLKAPSSLAGPNDDVRLPRSATKIDWEIELGIVIGTPARYVAAATAMEHVAGFVIINDISDREAQLERGGSWDKGKAHDGFGPMGPWLVTPEEIGDGRGLSLTLEVNGDRRQSGTTDNMIFDVPTLISYLSEFMTLQPGDVIATGTPAGVGLVMQPQRFLSANDELLLRIDGLGEQRHRMVAG